MNLGLLKKRVRMVSIALLAMMALESNITQYLGEELRALAASPGTVTSSIAFTAGGAEKIGTKYYASSNYLSGGTVNITNVPAGNVIKRILHNGEDITPPAAIGVKDYSGAVNDTHSGTQITVASTDNSSAKGYYAWYRYIPGGSQGSNWYADVFDKSGNSVKISCGPSNFGPATHHRGSSAPTESIGGYFMPKFPGCDSTDFPELQTLSLSATRDSSKPYKTDAGVSIVDSVVSNVTATKATVNTAVTPIIGPNGQTGLPRSSAITVVDVTSNASDAGEYRVLFQQKFTNFVDGFDSEYEINSPANGAKVVTYYTAFLVDLQGFTYEYDGNVTVEYETPPNAPNISSVSITAPSCVQAGSSTSFSFSFSNTGGTDITTAFSARVVIDGATYQTFNYTGLASGTPKTETFTKNFAGTSMYNVAIFVDTVSGESNTGDNSKSVTVTPVLSCAALPVPESITGTFTLDKTSMTYGDDNWATPVGVAVTGTDGSGNACVMNKFGFIFEQNGLIADGVSNTSSPSTGSFAGPPYPRGMGEGVVNVTMKIFSSCGGSKVVGPQTFTISIDTDNAAPFFTPGWFANRNTNNYPTIDEIVVGNFVDLGVVLDKSRTPNEPYDPDGDGFYFNWDFKGSTDPWIKSFADTSTGYGFSELAYDGDTYRNIKADVLGYHTVYATATDNRGAKSGRRSATINVVKPNPIAACTAPSEVKANHPLAANAINADKSRSPMGRTIDHSRDVWTNKLPVYSNNTMSDITVAVTLERVYDSSGLESENISSCNIIVHPDYPPIAKINAPSLGIRGDGYDILNESYSTDGDNITQVLWYIKYDADNDGNLDEESWTSITGDLNKYSFSPTKVGKYKFKLRAVEEFGAFAEAESGIMDVINQAPEVSFDLSGNGPNPDPNPPTVYKASDILATWPLVATNTNSVLSKLPTYNWQNDNETLATGAGKGKESQIFGVNRISTPAGLGDVDSFSAPLNDNGLGRNGLSIYKAMTSPTFGYSQPLFYPGPDGQPAGWVSGATPVSSDKVHLYFTGSSSYSDPSYKFYALNKNKIGRYEGKYVQDTTSCTSCFATFSYKHYWLDGNPYDYTLDINNVPRSQLTSMKDVPYYVNSSNTGTTRQVSESISNAAAPYLAEKTVYLIFTKITPVKYTRDTSGDSDQDYITSVNSTMACSFKALDGTRIACFDIPGSTGQWGSATVKATLTSGDHLLILMDSAGYYSPNGYFGDSYYEVDLYGNILKAGTIPNNNPPVPTVYEKKYAQWPYTDTPRSYTPAQYDTASCSYAQYQQPFRDNMGNTYFYETKTCVDSAGNAINSSDRNLRFFPELGLGVYVAKYDKNFKVVWRARTGGNNLYFSAAWTYDWRDNLNTMIVNPANNTIISKTLYTVGGSWGDSRSIVNNVIDMTTGGVWGWGGPQVSGMSANLHVDAWGNYQGGKCAANIFNQCSNISTGGNSATLQGSLGFMSSATQTVSKMSFSEYMGDGLLLSAYMYHSWVTGYNSPPYGDTVYWIDKGPIAEAAAVNIQRYQYGQFISPNVLNDADIAYNFKTEQNKIDTNLFGYSFRMQDGANRYALEFDGTSMYLSKYVSGGRTVLASAPYNIQDSKSYSVKIRTSGNVLNVWVNKVNYFSDIVDNSFPTSGKFGAFSDKSFVQYSAMTSKPYAEADLWSADYAILDEDSGKAELKYDNIKFEDPELDPIAGSFAWTYTHIPMFRNNGGLSPLSGQSFASGQPTFDRVGKWDIALRAKDDPYPAAIFKYPNMLFDSYRKNSNTFKKSITVHRRPVAVFTAAMQPNGVVNYTANSYDPDRYDIGTGGMDAGYEANHGIFEEKWYYITPDGNVINSKLDRVQDSGTYTIVLQVKDEYGAWSWPATEIIDVGLRPNNPPTVILTYPGGSVDKPDFFCVGCNPTISWSQNDIDPDTTFTAYEVYIGQITTDWMGRPVEYDYYSTGVKSFTSKAAAYSYIATNVVGSTNAKWHIKVRVKDETTWSQWSNDGYLGSVLPPTVSLTYPTGTYENPSSMASLKPTITWNQLDPQNGSIVYQQVRVWNESGTLLSSGDTSVPVADRPKTQASWTMTADAPLGAKLKVQVRVQAVSGVWSDWSTVGWMTSNSPPSANMTNPSGTQAAPTIFTTTKPTFEWNQTDPDVGTVFSHFQIEVTNEDNTVMVLDSGVTVQDSTSNTGSWTVPSDLPTGQKLRVRVRVFDGYVWSNFSPQTWFLINRPPTGNITFITPIYQHDTPTFTVNVSDPDNNAINVIVDVSFNAGAYTSIMSWSNVASGSTRTFTYGPLNQGVYTLRLNLDDGLGGTYVQTYTFTALPLSITGQVTHTPQWEAYRQSWNVMFPSKSRTANVFWAGEAFELSAQVTDTGTSSTKPVSVNATLVQTNDTAAMSSSDLINYTGEMLNTNFDTTLSNGPYTMRFTVNWSNGLVQTTDVPITIAGDIWDVIVNQLRN
ncbi:MULTISPECIES: CARDB domain-containing protein [unclassified Paenibacillus]|uniref:CARDB domain-containing protein n=1 Tax=unclassified Paenibacillus TaxID=185978 RepID=UPI00277F280F|nr:MULTISPECIES: CARDB domain-containing protein [unclassified Paenibacillus]MDQ0896199.1 hypothetical protein [Paenibacillus sp. V4I7]MDQ0913985.1 hypothetical protein [Paenibacillus sp. V4I5]